MGRIVRGVKVGPSPEWMVKYLTSIGGRSINNIVDATNIVMFDIGQPIHAFDLDKLSSPSIVIRELEADKEMELVGSEKIKAKLQKGDLMITDKVEDIALAGIKGGLSSGVSDNTKDILIEVANFDPARIRKTARRLGILTDASKRFENDLSPNVCSLAMDEISALVLELCPEAVFEKVVDVYPNEKKERIITFTSDYISKMLGVNISSDEIEKILKNYNYNFSINGELFEITVPDMRIDLTSPRDFVEEIGRAYGYEKIEPKIPEIQSSESDNKIWTKICLAKQKLIDDGYKEVMAYAFCDKGEVEVLASASDKSFLRTNLTDGLKESIDLNQRNLPLLETNEIKLFEVGTVFTKKGEEIKVAYGDKKKITEVSLTEFTKDLIVLAEGKILTTFSDFEFFKPWSNYPFVTRDIAVWVKEGTKPEALLDIYRQFGTELLIKEPKLFDSFTKDGRTSFAYRLVFQSYDRTLTDDEINKIIQEITDKIKSLGFEVR